MVRAFASPQPLLSRKFLERALVISALVHLTAAGLFRAADERSRAGESIDSRRIKGIIEVVPRLFPPPIARNWSPAPTPPATNGIVTPVDKIVRPVVDVTRPGIFDPPEAPPVSQGGGGKDGPDITTIPPRDEPSTPFIPVDTAPTPIQAPHPPYPEWAREAGIEGTVLLKVLVGVDGIPRKVEIVRGPKGLRDEAARAVSRWTFTPGLANHRPVEVWVEVPVVFTLQ